MAIPEGVERVGEMWFIGSDVESVEIPASVTAIEKQAFLSCKRLKRVTFAEGSRLEKIGAECFYCSDIEEITLPGTLREIGEDAFYDC